MGKRDDDALEKLRAAGVARQRAASEARNAARLESTSAGERATSAIGLMASKTWWALVFATSVPGVAISILGLLFPTKPIPGGTMETVYLPAGIGVLTFAALLAILIVVARSLVPRALASERAWAASLPFVLEGQLGFYESGYGAFRLEFAGNAPDRATLASLIAGIAGPALVLDDHGGTTIKVDRIEHSARRRWRDLHEIVQTFLVPLHARYSLEAVRFS